MISKDEKYLAILTGINEIKEIENLKQIVIYEIKNQRTHSMFKEVLNFDLPKEYCYYSKTISFDYRTNRKSDLSLLMWSKSDIVSIDFSNHDNPVIH